MVGPGDIVAMLRQRGCSATERDVVLAIERAGLESAIPIGAADYLLRTLSNAKL